MEQPSWAVQLINSQFYTGQWESFGQEYDGDTYWTVCTFVSNRLLDHMLSRPDRDDLNGEMATMLPWMEVAIW